MVWGGSLQFGEEPFDNGFVFDPRADSWRELPPAPLSARSASAAVWTGREVLIWGGMGPKETGEGFGDGAAYDPAQDSWRMLPPAPLSPRVPFGAVAVWTGREMIVWGSTLRQERVALDGAAYDPAQNTWRRIPEAPFGLNEGAYWIDSMAVWTGQEMLVLGVLRDPNNGESPQDTTLIAAYDPEIDQWRRPPPPDLTPFAADLAAVWTGSELLAIDDYGRVSAYDPDADAWHGRPAVPVEVAAPQAAFAGGQLFLETFGSEATYDPGRGFWTDVSEMIPPPNGYYRPVAAGSVILLWEVDPHGKSPHALLAWKP